jgi:hypothetical protein
MPYGAHIHGHKRVCSATTTVENQSSVYVNDQLWAVRDSTNNHGLGGLIPTGQTVYVENKLVICHTPDSAQPDFLCFTVGGNHCDPKTDEGSGDTFCY